MGKGAETDMRAALRNLYPGQNYILSSARALSLDPASIKRIASGHVRLSTYHRNRLIAYAEKLLKRDRGEVIRRVMEELDRQDAKYTEALRFFEALPARARAARKPVKKVGRPRSRVARLVREITSRE